MYAKSRKKRWWIPVTALLLVAALGAGIWFTARGSGEPVNVYPFQYIGMTEFWGDAQESYGPVTTDKIQTEFLSDTQTVTEVMVKSGDIVKKGDVLFSFDTTLDALSLERKRLEVEKVKVQIKAAEERLQETREIVPYVPPGETDPEEGTVDLGDQLKDRLYQISENAVYDGSKPETALVCWIREDTAISDVILQILYETSLKYRQENADKEAAQTPETEEQPDSSASAVPTSVPTVSAEKEKILYENVPAEYRFNGEKKERDLLRVGAEPYKIVDAYTHQGKTYWLKSAKRISDGLDLQETGLMIDAYPQSGSHDWQDWQDAWEEGIFVEYVRGVSFQASHMKEGKLVSFADGDVISVEEGKDVTIVLSGSLDDLQKVCAVEYTVTPANGILTAAENDGQLFLTGTPETPLAVPEAYTVKAMYTFDDNFGQSRAVEETFSFDLVVMPRNKTAKDTFYVVFKITQDNYLKGTRKVWQGAQITAYEDGSFGMSLYDAAGFADHTLPVEDAVEIELPEILPDEQYTAEQILEMQKELYATIKEQNEKLKMAESEYAIMERELGDGNVYAEIDGKVVSLLTEEESRQQKQPILKLSGGGGFYIEGSVSELEKEKLKLGQEVTINDWNTGNMYTGEVISIGDFPSDDDNWNGMGNPTASYYPFKAFVGEEADLQAGNFVSMSYSTASAEQGIYLEKAFVRTENGNSYIFVRGADGKLEKRSVRVGKVLWGSYYEVLSSLGEEDYLAFPYGKNVKPGAPTVESDLSALYGY